MIISYILLSSSPPRKQVHSLPNGFVGNGDIGAHSGFVGVSGDLLDDSGGDAELEGNAYEGAAGSVGSEELPFRVYFIVSYTSPIISINAQKTESASEVLQRPIRNKKGG